jgi:hypothetical protein
MGSETSIILSGRYEAKDLLQKITKSETAAELWFKENPAQQVQ